ncbi:MAG TPA: hypothetical protein VM935_06585 [Chitinophagaceae bacterium]|jgi:hypothetical protein|nr:hypothetical protein [Chitinophagaceae bacterium]
MRKLSFPSLCFIVMLGLSSCTKDNVQQNPTPGNQVVDNPQTNYSTSYSDWTSDGLLSWDVAGTATEPSITSNWFAPMVTQERIDAGGVVLIYAKSSIDGSVHPLPWNDGAINNERVNSYDAAAVAGSIVVNHSSSINGVSEVPQNSNNVSFRYIIVGPHIPAANAREITISELGAMPYEEVVRLLGIPE